MTDEDELLGCIIAGADPTELDLRPEDFAEPRNEWIFRACIAAADAGRRCDPQTIAIELGPDAAKLPDGPLHLVNLASGAIPLNAPAYADRVRTAADRRSLIEAAQRIIQHAQSPDRDPAEVREDARGWLDKPTQQAAIQSLADLLPAFVDRVESGIEPGLSTPWPDLDWFLHGLHPGRLYTIGGRPGGGKSVMLTNLAAHFANHHGQRVFFATLEMPAQELVGRIVAAAAQISQTSLSGNRMTELDWERLGQHSAAIAAMPLHICDEPTQTLQSLRSGARDVQRRGGLGLVVVDYLQLLTPPDRKLSRQQQIGELTRGLKRMAKELDVPVVTASQLRRGQSPKDKPTMSDLRESGDIEADSDVIVLLHAEDDQKPWNLTVHVEKNRSGPRGPLDLFFDTTRACMGSSDWRHSA